MLRNRSDLIMEHPVYNFSVDQERYVIPLARSIITGETGMVLFITVKIPFDLDVTLITQPRWYNLKSL